jgi:hypothetical protein
LIRERWTASALSQISGELHRAPEQELGGEGDARSDQYALGGLLFRMLTGYTTLSSGIPVGDVILRMNERAARLPNQPSPVPSGVAVVILKATSQNPKDRYDSVLQMYQAFEQASVPNMRLEAAAASQAVTGKTTPRSLPPREPSARTVSGRRRWVRLGITGVLLLVALSGFVLFFANNPRQGSGQPGALQPVTILDGSQLTAQAATIQALWTQVAAGETGSAESTGAVPPDEDQTATAPSTTGQVTPTVHVTPTWEATASDPQTQIPGPSLTPGGNTAAPPGATATRTDQPPVTPPASTNTAPPVPTQTSLPPTNTQVPPTHTSPPPTNTPWLPLPTLPLPTLPLPTLPLPTLPL